MEKNEQAVRAEKIQYQYTHIEKEKTNFNALVALDEKVKIVPKVFAAIFGSLGALIMGSGMSLIMTDIGQTLGMSETMIPGIIIGAVGMLIAAITYPIYCGILKARKKKYAPQIIELTEQIADDK